MKLYKLYPSGQLAKARKDGSNLRIKGYRTKLSFRRNGVTALYFERKR